MFRFETRVDRIGLLLPLRIKSVRVKCGNVIPKNINYITRLNLPVRIYELELQI